MPARSRAFLLGLAVALVVAVYGLGVSFTYSAELPERARGSELYWLLLALLFASPLWVPAALPARWGRVLLVVRWLSAAALLVPLRYAVSVALNQLQVYPGQFFSVTTLTVASLLSLGCVAAIVVLLWPSSSLQRRP